MIMKHRFSENFGSLIACCVYLGLLVWRENVFLWLAISFSFLLKPSSASKTANVSHATVSTINCLLRSWDHGGDQLITWAYFSVQSSCYSDHYWKKRENAHQHNGDCIRTKCRLRLLIKLHTRITSTISRKKFRAWLGGRKKNVITTECHSDCTATSNKQGRQMRSLITINYNAIQICAIK
jgi:hypothetical protein